MAWRAQSGERDRDVKPVALGVIGCGVMGRNHLHNARNSALIDIVAVADPLEERARKAAEEFDVVSAYTDAAALLADQRVEAVLLAFPTRGRTEIALRAFEAGKHVLIEKPVAMNAQEVLQMIEARGKLVAGCCSARMRFLSSAEAATAFIASGALGELRVLYCRVLVGAGKPPESPPPPWRLSRSLNGGGILMNWGCYDLDYLLGLTGWSLAPHIALARAWPVPPQLESHVAPGSDAEAHFAAIVCCDGGTAIMFERGEYVAAESQSAWQITGSKGSLRLDMWSTEEKAVVYACGAPDEGVTVKTIWQGRDLRERIGPCLLEDFATAIREDRQPRTSLEQALVVQRITDAIYRSAQNGEAARIEG